MTDSPNPSPETVRIAELEAALQDVIDGWDWWRVDPGDRESPHDEIEAGRAILATPVKQEAPDANDL
jgi:hypothetical protein